MKYYNDNLFGLILIGGKSKRMGKDKAFLNYFGKTQFELTKELLTSLLPKNNIYYSINNEQDKLENCIVDKYPNLGPFGAILSAFEYNPNHAYLVMAIDMPFVTPVLIKKLITNRDASKFATVVQGQNNDYPEPLLSIWEPKAFPVLQAQFEAKQYKLTKILKDNAIKRVFVEEHSIQNINTLENYKKVKKSLSNK